MSKKIKLGRNFSKEKIDFLGKTIDLPKDPFGKNSHITIYGNYEIIIDGCFGIVEYDTELVKINIGKGLLAIFGNNFNIADYSDNSIIIRGKILRLDFI